MTVEETLLFYRNELKLPIFPVSFSLDEKGKVNKRPAVQWGKYQKELPTEEEIKSWCNRYTGWGLATGELSRIVVVDVDMDKIDEAEVILGCSLRSTMMVTTGSGKGTHIYYKWDEELRNTVKLEGAPIDFRGDGGYVVIPPSKSEWGEYSWFREPTDMLRMMLPELPEQIKSLLKTPRNKVSVTLDGTSNGVFKDGERNAASTIAIRKLLGDIPQSQWLTTGWYAFNYWCKAYCRPALDDYQIKATFEWWVRANAKGHAATGKNTMEIGLERIEERKVEKMAPTTGYPSLDTKMKGWIPGHLYVLTGETNAGKSAAACNFAYRVYAQQKKVTYFALEPDVGVIEYIAGIHHKKQWDQITDEDVKMDLKGMTIYTKEADIDLNRLVKLIQESERQDLIIVDHIGYFTTDGGSKLSQTQQESNATKKIISAAKAKKTAVLIIAHPRKPMGSNKKNNPLTMNEISGSASFKQDATDIMIIHMDKDPSDVYGLTNLPTGRILLPKVKTGTSGNVPIKFVPNSPVMLEQNEAAKAEAMLF